MKNINFIKPISSSQASSIRLWLTGSLLVGCALILGMGIVTWQEYFYLRALQHNKERLQNTLISFNTIMQKKQELKKQEQIIKDQLNLIVSAGKQTQQHAQLMTHIKRTLKNTLLLESFNLESNNLQLCIDCAQTQQASEIITSLAQLPDISSLHMNSLQPKQQGTTTALRLNLRGTIKQNS